MKRIGKIILTLFMMLVLVGTWFVRVNWNTIMAFYISVTYTPEELMQRGEKINAELQSYVQREKLVVRDMNEQEKTALNEGKINTEQVKQILTGQTTLEAELEKNKKDAPAKEDEKDEAGSEKDNKPDNKPEEKPSEAAKPPAPAQATNTTSTDQKISEYIAELYICKNDFMTKLGNLEKNISDEFYSLPKEQWNMQNKERIINKHVGQVGQWEKDCDATVYELLDKIKTTLIEANRNTDIVSKIEENYLNEKQIKKAEYMQIYTRKSKEDK